MQQLPHHARRPQDGGGPAPRARAAVAPAALIPTAPQASDMALDRGLRRYMLAIYNKVALGLLVSAALAWTTSSVPAARDLLFKTAVVDGTPKLVGMSFAGALVAIAPMVVFLVFTLSGRKSTPLRAAALYWSIVALIGASLGVLVLSFTGSSIAISLASAAAAFGALSLVGYSTRNDLSALRSFLMVGLIGLLVAMGANLFIGSSGMAFVTSALGVLIFAGLIAYDTQRLKLAYYDLGEDAGELSIATSEGALSLYINFINLFQFLLMLMNGERR
jgi:FtsH-binding integral membrane protein